MSAVFMCDNCGNLFSVNEDNWTEYTKKTSVHNTYNHGAQTMHMGPCCNGNSGTVVRPRVMLTELEDGKIA